MLNEKPVNYHKSFNINLQVLVTALAVNVFTGVISTFLRKSSALASQNGKIVLRRTLHVFCMLYKYLCILQIFVLNVFTM